MDKDTSKKRRVTLNDIAKQVGTSTSTVSRVLNNSILIGEETRERILKTADEIGYRKRTVRGQEARKILNIGLVLPSYEHRSDHLFFDVAELLSGLQDGFGEVRARIHVTLSNAGVSLFDSKKQADLDGCVFAFNAPKQSLRAQLRKWEIPWVVLNRVSKTFNFVSVDNQAGMIRLVEQAVIRWGREMKPCYVDFGYGNSLAKIRKAAFRKGLLEAGYDEDSAIEWSIDGLHDVTVSKIVELRARGVNAIFCFNDVLAVYLYQVAVQAGILIPEDIGLAGFDYSPIGYLLVEPLDTVMLPVGQLGFEAGAWLRRCVIDKNQEPMRKFVKGEYVAGATIRVRR